MDAGIMDGTSLLFGAVGAVPGIKNPIMVAKLMVEEQQKGLLPLGTAMRLFVEKMLIEHVNFLSPATFRTGATRIPGG